MKWRSTLLLFAAGALVGALCGCGSEEPSEEVPVEAAVMARESAPEAPAPIEELAQALTELGAPPAADTKSEGAGEGDALAREQVAALSREIQGLREEVAKLEETLEVYLDVVVGDLKHENARLRQELVQLYARGGLREADGNVPRPGQQFIDQILRETPYDEDIADAAFVARLDGAVEEGVAPEEADSFDGEPFAVIKEWGRGPAEVAALGKDIPTLRGMICAVPEGTPEEQLMVLGQSLRAENDAYDNINIEVFEGMAAAQEYADTNQTDPARRLMSVSKHTASGRDVILLMTQGMTREVPIEPGGQESVASSQ